MMYGTKDWVFMNSLLRFRIKFADCDHEVTHLPKNIHGLPETRRIGKS